MSRSPSLRGSCHVESSPSWNSQSQSVKDQLNCRTGSGLLSRHSVNAVPLTVCLSHLQTATGTLMSGLCLSLGRMHTDLDGSLPHLTILNKSTPYSENVTKTSQSRRQVAGWKGELRARHQPEQTNAILGEMSPKYRNRIIQWLAGRWR